MDKDIKSQDPNEAEAVDSSPRPTAPAPTIPPAPMAKVEGGESLGSGVSKTADFSPAPLPAPQETQTGPVPNPVTPEFAFRNRMREARIRKYEGKLRLVYELAKTAGKITNDDIQKHLRVSDATASRYVREMVKRGLMKASGRGKFTSYEAV